MTAATTTVADAADIFCMGRVRDGPIISDTTFSDERASCSTQASTQACCAPQIDHPQNANDGRFCEHP